MTTDNRHLPPFFVCAASQLADGMHIKRKMLFEGRDEECLVFRFKGAVFAYINRCVHMPRPLDCQQDLVFDHTGRYLRCSMHGIVFTPETGTSISTMCEGQQLRTVEISEENGRICITDFRVSGIA